MQCASVSCDFDAALVKRQAKIVLFRSKLYTSGHIFCRGQ